METILRALLDVPERTNIVFECAHERYPVGLRSDYTPTRERSRLPETSLLSPTLLPPLDYSFSHKFQIFLRCLVGSVSP